MTSTSMDVKAAEPVDCPRTTVTNDGSLEGPSVPTGSQPDTTSEEPEQFEDTSWKKIIFVDNVARWLNEDGNPGDEVDFGTQKWRIQVEDDIMKIAPAALSDGERDDSSWLDNEPQQQALAEALARGDHDNPLVEAAVMEFVRKLTYEEDSNEDGSVVGEQNDGYLDRNLAKELVLRMLTEPHHQIITPIDNNGKLDVDFFNTDHKLSERSQLTMDGLLSLQRAKEEAQRGNQGGREINLQRYIPKNVDVGVPDLDTLSDTSESSVVSISHCGPKETYPKCDDGCWLRQPILEERPEDAVRKPAQEVASQKSSTLAPNIYQQLPPNSMRVLRLLPGTEADPIVCQMEVVDTLSANVQSQDHTSKDVDKSTPNMTQSSYEALSYTWGNPTKNHYIRCNDTELGVTQNLYTALLYLRHAKHDRRLWVDAICINQANLQERNNQVRKMFGIYQGAARVLVWLGVSADDSDYAIEGMRLMDKPLQRRKIMQCTHEQACRANLLRLLLAQRNLLKRAWFSRSWVRQEISAAREVVAHCGTAQLSWFVFKRSSKRLEKIVEKLKSEDVDVPLGDDNLDTLDLLRSDWRLGDSLLRSAGDIRSIWYYHTGGLLDLLMAGRAFDASDPRDKIYSCLGMAEAPIEGEGEAALTSGSSKSSVEAMRIDYSSTVSEVYQYLAKYMVNRDRNLDVLSILPQHRDSNSTDLPSWVPDWRVSTSSISLGTDMSYYTRKAAACGHTEAFIQDYKMLGILKVRGAYIADIKELPGITSGQLPDPPVNPFSRLYQFDPRVHVRQVAFMQFGNDDDEDNQSVAFVPRDTCVGDAIYILYGSKYPMVLRDFGVVEAGVSGVGRLLRAKVVGPAFMFERVWMFGAFMQEVLNSPEDGDGAMCKSLERTDVNFQDDIRCGDGLILWFLPPYMI